MNLIQRQRLLRDHLLSGAGGAAPEICGDASAGLAVYYHAYRAQLIDCLRDTYEKLALWLGDEMFETAALTYVEANPPRSWTLADYGADFAGLLAMIYPDDPEVAELAWLDWTLRRAFDGADAAPISADELGEVDWDAAVFTFAPTLSLNLVRTNCAALWSAMAENVMPPPAALLSDASTIRVWRSALTPQFKTISALEARALRLALAEFSFGEICKIAIDEADDTNAVNAAGQLLSAWLSDGIIQGVR